MIFIIYEVIFTIIFESLFIIMKFDLEFLARNLLTCVLNLIDKVFLEFKKKYVYKNHATFYYSLGEQLSFAEIDSFPHGKRKGRGWRKGEGEGLEER